MNRTIFSTGIVFGVFAIIFGAFGAHGLKELVDSDAILIFETGVKYQMYHAIFLMILATNTRLPEKSKKLVFGFVVAGVIFFSFSIYGLATNSLTSFDFKSIGFITPLGGLLLIFAWILLGYRAYKQLS